MSNPAFPLDLLTQMRHFTSASKETKTLCLFFYPKALVKKLVLILKRIRAGYVQVDDDILYFSRNYSVTGYCFIFSTHKSACFLFYYLF